jgi:anaerobic selenocysteine-containing dehydrogenase
MNNDLLKPLSAEDVDRRDFIKGASMSTLMMMLGSTILVPSNQARGQDSVEKKRATSPPVKLGVIGCGVWGRDIIGTFGQLPNAPVVAICDLYPA